MHRSRSERFRSSRFDKALALGVALLFLSLTPARGIILLGTDDPTISTTPPAMVELANSGWQYEGQFVAILGMPIAPHFFLTAKHIGAASGTFIFQGANYTAIKQFNDPYSDLRYIRLRCL